MGDLNQNLRDDASVSDIQILNQLIRKNTGSNTNDSRQQQPKQNTSTTPANDLASVKLFKRMTALKKENMDLEKENQALRDKLDELYFLN
jgi:hypothetical protein